MEYGCDSIKDLICRYLSKTLSDEENIMFEKHIAACDKCRAELALFEEMDRFLDDMACEPPAELKERVLSDVKRERHRKILYRIAKITLPVAAMFAVVLLCAYPRIAKKETDNSDADLNHDGDYVSFAEPGAILGSPNDGEYPDILFFFDKEGFLLGSEKKIPEGDNPEMADKDTDAEGSAGEICSENDFLSTSVPEMPGESESVDLSVDIEIPEAGCDLIQSFYLPIHLVKSYFMTHKLPNSIENPVTVFHYCEYDIYIYESDCDFLPDNMTTLYETGEYSLIIIKNEI